MFGAAQQLVAQHFAFQSVSCSGKFSGLTSVLCGGWCPPDFRLGARGWKAHRRFGVGSQNVGIYPIHILSAWFGPVATVSAFSADADQVGVCENLGSGARRRLSQAIDCWTLSLRFHSGQVASILSSLSLSAKGANEAYSMTLRGDRGAITLDAMWSGNSRIRFVPEGGEAGQGVSQELFHGAFHLS